jgi:hypothetical protein
LKCRGRDRKGGKIIKNGEMTGVTPDDLIHRTGFPGWAGKFGMAGILQIVDEAEEVFFNQLKPAGGAIGDTEEFDGIVVEASFYGMVTGGADLDGAIEAFELLRRVGIGQRISGNAHQDELGGVIVILFQGRFEPGVGAVFPVSCQQPVAHPIEKQDR